MNAQRDPERVLVLAPGGRDGQVASAILSEAGLHARACTSLPDCEALLREGAGVAVIADEALIRADLKALAGWVRDQPAWSDMPFVILTRQGGAAERNPVASRLTEALGNVTFLERPFHPTTLVSVARSALRSRGRQYEARDRLAAVRDAEDRLRLALEAGRLGAWELDLATQRLDASPRCKANFGRRPDEPFTYEDLQASIHPDDLPGMQSAVEAAVASQGDFSVDYRATWPDGSLQWLEIRGRVRRHGGQATSLVGVSLNVTARKQAEDEREALVSQLSSANRAKDEFLAMLGHELRNPLSPIVTALHLMKMRAGGDTSREQAVIQRQVNHLVRLVDDLLDVAKITSGKVELRREWLSIEEVITKAVEIASHLLEQRQHQLRIHLSGESNGDPLRLHGDPVRLAQSVANLLVNAARYTPPGGRIELGAQRQAGQVVISVKDNGIGIAPDLLPRIFNLFVQGRRNIDRAEGGLGLGLALVRNLVALHGGSVWARSAGPGQGSEFFISLPASLQAPATPAPPAAPVAMVAPDASRKRRVLVVDDNADAAESLAELLTMEGHEVLMTLDPLSALERAPAFEPDIAILDIGLPGMDGYELAQHLLPRLDRHACTLIALTGYGQKEDRAQSAAAGFAAHLTKPVDFVALVDLIDRFTARHAEQDTPG
ncbi:MAG: response regulator [Rubrivivax sp.]|nr:MAG: response regulator [Rubrivivax sp.]